MTQDQAQNQILLKLLKDAVAAGYLLEIGAEEEIDYSGTDPAKALEALQACDEMVLHLSKSKTKSEWALIISSLEANEIIADCAGPWIEAWCDDNLSKEFSR